MKKTFLIVLMVFLNLALFSCTPEQSAEELVDTQACCGDDGQIPPPPPPPPPGGNN